MKLSLNFMDCKCYVNSNKTLKKDNNYVILFYCFYHIFVLNINKLNDYILNLNLNELYI